MKFRRVYFLWLAVAYVGLNLFMAVFLAHKSWYFTVLGIASAGALLFTMRHYWHYILDRNEYR